MSRLWQAKVGNRYYFSGPGYSKLTTLLVKDLLDFQKLISQICQYFLLKNVRSLTKKFSVFGFKVLKHLMS